VTTTSNASTEIPATHLDLVDVPVATLGTIGPDGRPHLSEVWFLFEGGEFKLSLHEARQKTRNIRRSPVASLLILDLQNPLRYLEIRGDADVELDADYAFAQRVGTKYGGVDFAAMDGDDRRRVVVTIRPTRVVGVDMAATG
jgi:PPOX class probable F420-dependent enzyme